MSADSEQDFFDQIAFGDLVMVYHALTELVFDSILKDIVRGRYHLSPVHITLQVDREQTMLFVKEETVAFMDHDPRLREWAMQFIAQQVFNLDPDAVESIYLDGPVGRGEPYLRIAGNGILIVSGQPQSKGSYL